MSIFPAKTTNMINLNSKASIQPRKKAIKKSFKNSRNGPQNMYRNRLKAGLYRRITRPDYNIVFGEYLIWMIWTKCWWKSLAKRSHWTAPQQNGKEGKNFFEPSQASVVFLLRPPSLRSARWSNFFTLSPHYQLLIILWPSNKNSNPASLKDHSRIKYLWTFEIGIPDTFGEMMF